jgi:hypothetical protein
MAVSSDSGSLLNTRSGWGPMPGRDNHLHRRAGAILVHPHKVGRPPAAVVARGTGREHRLSSGTVTDQPPGLASEILVERMRMPDLRRDGLATPRAAGAQGRVPFCSVRAALRWQDAPPDLTAPNVRTPVRGRHLRAQHVQHRGGAVKPDAGNPLVSDGQEHAAGAAADLQHRPARLASEAQVERNIGAVTQGCIGAVVVARSSEAAALPYRRSSRRGSTICPRSRCRRRPAT